MRIKILECIRQGQIGGGESHLLSLVENLDKTIYEPFVLSFTEGPMVDACKALGIESRVIHTEKPFDISKWKKVKKLMQDEKISLVHAHGTRATSNVFWAARSLKIPIVYTIHGWSFHDNQNDLVKKIRVWSEKFLTSKMDVNISVSASNRNSGQREMKNFISSVINNGIDQDKFNPEKKSRDIREELKIKKEAIVLLFMARFTEQKQPVAMVHAFEKAIKREPSIHLLMVGDGDQKKEVLDIVNDSIHKPGITFQPFRQDVPDILAAADIFVLPSLWEGLPIGLLEAMSMGKAVIATNVDGTSEIIESGINGVLIPVDNLIERLADAIVLLTQNNDLRISLGQNAIKTVKNRFNAEKMTRQIESVYAGLLKKLT